MKRVVEVRIVFVRIIKKPIIFVLYAVVRFDRYPLLGGSHTCPFVPRDMSHINKYNQTKLDGFTPL